MVGISKATLLGLGLCSLIVLISTVCAQNVPQASGTLILNLSNPQDNLKLTTVTKGKVAILLKNAVGSPVRITCSIQGQSSVTVIVNGNNVVQDQQTFVYYFNSSDKKYDKLSCNVNYVLKNKSVAVEVYNRIKPTTTELFEVKLDGIYQRIKSW